MSLLSQDLKLDTASSFLPDAQSGEIDSLSVEGFSAVLMCFLM